MNRLNKILITGLFTVVCFSGCRASQEYNVEDSEETIRDKAFRNAFDFFRGICPTSADTGRFGIRRQTSKIFADLCKNIAYSKSPYSLSKNIIVGMANWANRPKHKYTVKRKTFDPSETEEAKQSICQDFELEKFATKEASKPTKKTLYDNFKQCVEVGPNTWLRKQECFLAFLGSGGLAGMFGDDFTREIQNYHFKKTEQEL